MSDEQIKCDYCGRFFPALESKTATVNVNGVKKEYKRTCPLCVDFLTMNIPKMGFDEVIRRMRVRKKALGWTDDELAEHAGLSHTTVSSILTGKSVTLYSFLDVLDALGLEIQVI